MLCYHTGVVKANSSEAQTFQLADRNSEDFFWDRARNFQNK